MGAKHLWFRLMLVAFLANGIGPFGLKILAEMNLSGQFTYQYLELWYLGGVAFALVAFLRRHSKPYLREVLIGGGMGMCSVGGQLSMALALRDNVPGHIVFPVVTGGNLFIVAAAGVILFKERIGSYGTAGIILGIASLVILSIP
ncbi:MAG TPA: hypothetical protein DHV65_12520 [Ktedonobacter sp.]|jgi:drug/metabolite transporter (DMT)-like permease|nr:hypothetical protein [Ktedonobacter sp.]